MWVSLVWRWGGREETAGLGALSSGVQQSRGGASGLLDSAAIAAAAPQPVRVEVWAESLRVEPALALPTLPRVRIQIRPIEPRTTFRWRSG